ncbi:hypothetical protein NDU88_003265 [Pleurodeles waltl]|uniref:Uncharacterized protein n=1 Tax=Pleurodeles waltl TaxID=8319 RepID=A0AAV7T4M2_PLEWA|nr:hypothetical protein NDU88_003265 [Pleurodeles waltl]
MPPVSRERRHIAKAACAACAAICAPRAQHKTVGFTRFTRTRLPLPGRGDVSLWLPAPRARRARLSEEPLKGSRAKEEKKNPFLGRKQIPKRISPAPDTRWRCTPPAQASKNASMPRLHCGRVLLLVNICCRRCQDSTTPVLQSQNLQARNHRSAELDQE